MHVTNGISSKGIMSGSGMSPPRQTVPLNFRQVTGIGVRAPVNVMDGVTFPVRAKKRFAKAISADQTARTSWVLHGTSSPPGEVLHCPTCALNHARHTSYTSYTAGTVEQ